MNLVLSFILINSNSHTQRVKFQYSFHYTYLPGESTNQPTNQQTPLLKRKSNFKGIRAFSKVSIFLNITWLHCLISSNTVFHRSFVYQIFSHQLKNLFLLYLCACFTWYTNISWFITSIYTTATTLRELQIFSSPSIILPQLYFILGHSCCLDQSHWSLLLQLIHQKTIKN